MYAALWRALPGPWWVRVLVVGIIATGVLYGLLWWVFPWVSPLLSPGDVAITPASSGVAR